MKRVKLWLVLMIMPLLCMQHIYAQSGPSKEQKKAFYGLVEKIEVQNGNDVTVTYYPIADFQSYMNTILYDDKLPDIKKDNKTSRNRWTFNTAEDCAALQQKFSQEGYGVVVVELDNKRLSLIRLDYRKFARSRAFGYK